MYCKVVLSLVFGWLGFTCQAKVNWSNGLGLELIVYGLEENG